jgi:hypothetical protein
MITDATDIGPRLARTEYFRLISKSMGSLANGQESILDRENSLLVISEGVEINAYREALC